MVLALVGEQKPPISLPLAFSSCLDRGEKNKQKQNTTQFDSGKGLVSQAIPCYV